MITISGKPVTCALANVLEQSHTPSLIITIVDDYDNFNSVVRDDLTRCTNEIAKRQLDILYLDGEIARLTDAVQETDDGGDVHGKNLTDLMSVRGSHYKILVH